jgi:hypothetical protein
VHVAVVALHGAGTNGGTPPPIPNVTVTAEGDAHVVAVRWPDGAASRVRLPAFGANAAAGPRPG